MTVSDSPLDSSHPAAHAHRSALLAGFLGWTLDAFDFFLVTMALTDIAHDFGKRDTDIAFSISITLAFRPLGALIFGLLADRYGRRLPLMLDLVFYSIFEILTGLCHTYWQFLFCRAMFGIGMGGEWGVGASLTMEKVPPRQRGLLSGLLQEGYAAGYLLAALAYRLIFPHVGWRPLFFLGGLPALLALFVRYGVPESEVWQQTGRRQWKSLLASVWRHRWLFLYLVFLMAMMNFSSHGTQDMFPTFLKRQWKFTPRAAADVTAFMMVGAILGGLVFGFLSDRIGRRRSMMLAFALALLLVPLAFAPVVVLLVLGAFLMQFMVQGAWGVIPAHITELADDDVRGFLPGFAYQCGVLIAGTIGYVQALLSQHMSWSHAMALAVSLIFAIAIVAVAIGPERRGLGFGGAVSATPGG